MNFEQIKQENFVFVYLTTKTCNVCSVLQPKILALVAEFDNATFHQIYLDEFPKATGIFMTFAVPTLIVYSKGQEILRASRQMSIDNIRGRLLRIYKLL